MTNASKYRACKYFICTVYNTTLAHFRIVIQPHVHRATYQMEQCPTTSKQHIQAFIELRQPHTIRALTQLFQLDAHYESCKNPSSAQQYCSKEESRIEGPIQIGKPIRIRTECAWDQLKVAIKKNDMLFIKENLLPLYVRYKRNIDLLLMETHQPKKTNHLRGIYISGPPGCGKSLFVNSLQNVYYKQHNKWFDGYNGEWIIALEDIDKKSMDWIPHYLKIWTDHYPIRGEIKGSTVNLQHDWFIITSNHTLTDLCKDLHPEDQKAIFRRFDCYVFFSNWTNDTTIKQIFDKIFSIALPSATEVALEEPYNTAADAEPTTTNSPCREAN